MNTRGYVELIRKAYDASYYRVTRMLGITDTSMDRWRKGKSEANEDHAVKIAELLQLDPLQVITELDIERAESEKVRALRKKIREIIKRSLSVFIIVLFTAVNWVPGAVQSVLCQIIRRSLKGFRYGFLRPLQLYCGRAF